MPRHSETVTQTVAAEGIRTEHGHGRRCERHSDDDGLIAAPLLSTPPQQFILLSAFSNRSIKTTTLQSKYYFTYMYVYYYKSMYVCTENYMCISYSWLPRSGTFSAATLASIEAPLRGLCAVVCFRLVDTLFQKKYRNELKLGQKLYFLPQRLKSVFFDIFMSWAVRLKNFKKKLSLGGNHATTTKTHIFFFYFLQFLQPGAGSGKVFLNMPLIQIF